jgi:hypothetical protein
MEPLRRSAADPAWPELRLAAWRGTRETVHRWLQIVGKLQLSLTPVINHWWNATLQISARGLTTPAIPYGDRWLEIELDVLDDVMRITTSDGDERDVVLEPRSVADFYRETMTQLHALGIDRRIWTTPVEIADPIPFERDEVHRDYDRDYMVRCWRILALTTAILTKFRARFIGKASPVQFFWGTFDLATNRYSGRRAPAFEGNLIEREAYSHETCAVGWWPGDARLEAPAFFSYFAPEPVGFGDAKISIPGAYYHPALKGFYLPYDDLRGSADPEATLLAFCQQTYAAGADLAGWPRAELERP